jgi:UDP-N-acetyl-D-mannosaminuronate dehydrogenase
MATIKVGVREFRERIASFLESDTPVAVTRRGETLGVYVPTRQKHSKTADISDLKAASNRLAEALSSSTKDFFESRTLEQLAEAQGVTSLKSPGDLVGGWPAEESIDDFLDLTRRTRR